MKRESTKGKELREKIERTLKNRKIDTDFLSKKSLEEVLEEVNIYHQELEYQNDELRRTRDELEVSKQLFVNLFNESPVGYVLFDSETRIKSVNKAFSSLVGVSVSDLKGMRFTDFIHPKNQNDFYFHIRQLQKNATAQRIQVRLNKTDNVEVIIDSNLHSEGELVFFRSAITDITKEVKLMYDLNERNKELKCLLDVSGIMSNDSLSLEQMIRKVANRLPESFEFPEYISIKITLEDLLIQSDGFIETKKNLCFPIIGEFGKIGQIQVHIKNDGILSLSNILKEEEELIIAIAKQVGRAIVAKRSAENLKRQENYYRTLLHGLHEDIIVIDSTYTITDVNETFLANNGLKRVDVVGHHCYEISHGINEPCHLRGEECKLKEVFKSGKSNSCQHQHTHHNSKIEFVDLILSPIKNEQGKVTHVVEASRNITELVKSQKAIRESEERFRLLITQMNQGMALHEVVKNDQGKVINYRFLEANNSFFRHTGLKRKEIIGKTVLDVLPNTEQYWIEIFGRVATTGKPIHFENFSRELGKWYYVDAYSPKPDQFAVIINDITEKVLVEKRIQESEERYRSLFENNHATMLIMNPETGDIVDSNPAAQTFYGWTKDEFKQLNINKINTLSDEEVKAEMRLAQAGMRKHFVFKHKLKTGELRDVEVFSDPVRIQGQELLYSLVHDITDKTKAENALRVSETKYKQLVENTKTIFWEFDRVANRWTYVSPQVKDFLGYKVSDWFDYNFWVNRIHPDDREQVIRTCETESARGIDHVMEYRFTKSNGEIVWLREEVNVVMQKGVPVILRGTMMDINKRKEAELALKESESNLLEAQRIAKLGRWELDLLNNQLKWSDTIFDIFEIDQKKFGANFDAFLNAIHPEDREIVNKEYTKSLTSRKPYEIEHRLKMPDGRVKWVLEFCNHNYNESGFPIRSIGIVQDITERKIAELALKSNEQKFQTLFKSLSVGVALISPDMRVLEANPQLKKWFPESNTSSQPFCYCAFTFEQRSEPCKGCPVAKTFKDGKSHEWEKESLTPNGLMYFRVVSTPILDEKGKVIAAVEMMDNITERRIAQMALAESEEKYRTLFETMEQGVVYQNREGFIFSANKAAQRILGLSLDQMQGRTSTDPRWKTIKEDGSDYHGDDHPAMVALRTGKSIRHEIMGVFHPNENDYRWIIVNAVPEFKGGQKEPFRVYATFTDITDRKRHEKMIKEQKDFLETLLQTIPNPVFYKNTEGKYTGCNKAFEKFVGLSLDDIIGKTVFDLSSNTLAEVYHHRDSELMQNPGKQQYEWIVKNFNQEERSVIFDKASLFDIKGNLMGIIGVITDITERKRAEEEVKLNAERLKSLVKIFEYKAENIQKLLDLALSESLKLTGSKLGYVYYYNEKKQEFILNSWSKDVMKECTITEPQTCYELGKTGIWGEVVRQKKEIIVNDFTAFHPLKKGYPKGHAELNKFMSIPVFVDDRIVAVVGVANKATDYTETDLNQLRLLMNSVWGIVQRKEDSSKIMKLSAAVEQSSASVVITDTKGTIEYVNPRFTEITGYAPQEAIGENPRVLNSGYHDTNFFTDLWNTILSGKDWRGQMVNRKKNGELYWESVSISPILNSKGEITNFIAIKDDITELKLAEEALRNSELKLRLMIEKSPDGIMLTDENGRVVTWNNALEQITRIKASDAIGVDVAQVHKMMANNNARDVKQGKIQSVVKEVLAKGKSSLFLAQGISEVQFDFDGERRYIELMKFVIPMVKGNLLASFVRDITYQKEADIAIRDREEKLRAIFDNSIQSFVILSPDFNIQAFNQVARDRAKYFFNKIFDVGKSVVDIYPKEQIEIFKKFKEKVICGESVQTETSLTDPKGNQLWFELHFSPVFDSEKNVVGIFFNSIDITQRKMAEQSMALALEREKELSELKSRFVSTVSHEFRTPLASIYSNTQLLQRYQHNWDDEKKSLCFNRVYESVNAMTSMLENVSLIGKEQSGRLSFRPEILNLHELLHQIVEESHLTLNQSNRIDTVIEGDFTNVLLDQVLLRHIITNLLTNALKYSPGKPNVLFSIKQVMRFVEFTVRDFGVGIPESDMPNIFEPFYRATNSEDFKGTGLGLSIVNQCVGIHGGDILLESKIGEGTTVKVTLPLRAIKM